LPTDFDQLTVDEKLNVLFQAFQSLAAASKKEASTRIRVILAFVLVTILNQQIKDCFTWLRDYVVELVKPAQLYRKVRRIYTNVGYSKTDLREYRLVTRPSIDARSGYRKCASTVAILRCGTLVRIRKRRKRFALVEWQDENTGEIVQGWMRHKYLKRVIGG
jgi:hypothetical protein